MKWGERNGIYVTILLLYLPGISIIIFTWHYILLYLPGISIIIFTWHYILLNLRGISIIIFTCHIILYTSGRKPLVVWNEIRRRRRRWIQLSRRTWPHVKNPARETTESNSIVWWHKDLKKIKICDKRRRWSGQTQDVVLTAHPVSTRKICLNTISLDKES